jgi:type II secretory pathway component HofQ
MLFSSKTTTSASRELVIFVTPKLVNAMATETGTDK